MTDKPGSLPEIFANFSQSESSEKCKQLGLVRSFSSMIIENRENPRVFFSWANVDLNLLSFWTLTRAFEWCLHEDETFGSAVDGKNKQSSFFVVNLKVQGLEIVFLERKNLQTCLFRF